MKVIFILTRKKGGVGRFVSEVTRELRKKGIKTKTISREDDLGIKSFLGSLSQLRSAVKKEKYDILISNDWSIALPLIGLKNHYVIFHGLSTGISGILQKVTYMFMGKRTIVVSDFLKKKFPKAKVIYEGVNLEKFKPLRKKKNKALTVGFAQKPSEEYHFGDIKEAVSLLGGTLLVAWEKGKDEKNVKYLGYIKEMDKFYNSIDVFVSLPPHYTGFNLVWLESMACNTPTVGCNYGIGEKLPITKVKKIEPKEIAKAIRKELRRKINYRNWIKKKGFTWEKCAKRMMEVIKG